MDKKALITAMKDSISNTLEMMFFLPLDLSGDMSRSEIINNAKGDIINCKIEFNGPFSGYYQFFIANDLAKTVSADFLGNDKSEITKEQSTETVLEIINMVAGNTFSTYDNQSIFDLGMPKIITEIETEDNNPDSKENIAFTFVTLDNDPILFELTIT